MQYISIYDKAGLISKQILQMQFWEERQDLLLDQEILKDEKKIVSVLEKRKPDMLIMVIDSSEVCTSDGIRTLKRMFRGIHIIFIGFDETYTAVRDYFTSGVFDYLVQPLDEKLLKQAVLRIYADFGMDYVINNLQLKTVALIDNIFLGGGQESYIIGSILDQIYRDWKEDSINCQMIADKAKYYIYQIIIERKTWLEKFLHRNDFNYHLGFSLKTKSEINRDWLHCFKEASAMVEKYKMIDDKLVYHIGKYVVVHVDEKLSLGDVAEGVFLNPSYISHIFKKTTGINFMDFMLEVKMDRAKVLLRDSKIRIYDVSETIGYSNPEYFSKRFKQKTGYSPVEYQEMLEEERNDSRRIIS